MSVFSLYTLVIVEVNIAVNQVFGLLEGIGLVAVDALRFEDAEEVFSRSVIQVFRTLDIEGGIPYS